MVKGVTRSFICNVGAGGPAPAAGGTAGGISTPSTTTAPDVEKKVEAKKKNLKSLVVTWALIFLTNRLCLTCSIKG